MASKKMKGALKKSKSSNPGSLLSIIAVGASAGGLEALQGFLSHLPTLSNTCIIIAQHLSPTHKSMLVQLLSRQTGISVAEAAHGKKLEPEKVYITPPNKEITIVNGKVHLQKPSSAIGPKPSVDVLFKSLPSGLNQVIIGIILSGTGSDGAVGVRAIKQSGGHVIAQEPETAKYNGMPLAAINTGLVDAVLAPEKMGEEIKDFLSDPLHLKLKNHTELEDAPALKQILHIMSERTGLDFSKYKLATISRRLEKRMSFLKLRSIEDYLKVIEKTPKEAEEMFNTILIGVTSFFRDMDAFGALEDRLHKVINAKTTQDPIRIWAPGCSTGEEAYSIAILLHRILKERLQQFTLQIFATDIDERAIAKARLGIYQESTLGELPPELVETYFINKGGGDVELVKHIRTMVLFSRHDVISNPPFLKLDLICCRNLLIYFDTELQHQVIPIFHYALNSGGYLFLGKSETAGHFSDLFTAVDSKHKIFQRRGGKSIHAVKFSAYRAQKQLVPEPGQRKTDDKKLSLKDLVRETLFKTYEHAYVVINNEQDIQEVNGDVRLFLSLTPGTIQVNLIKMVNPELQTEVRSVVMKAVKERASVKGNIKHFELYGKKHFVRINARPLIYHEGMDEFLIVIFEKLDIEGFVDHPTVEGDNQEINTRVRELEMELAATREQLQTYIEEIETSNEELQSLNEEMQSANEELQSTNEELETSSEELQSSNEEIQIAYTELKSAHDELERKEGLLKSLQADTEALLNNDLQALVMVDTSYKILKFNNKAIEVFDELVGKKITEGSSFIDLLPEEQVNAFIKDFKKASAGGAYQGERELVDAHGNRKWYSLNYSPVSYRDGIVSGISIGMLDVTDLKLALSGLSASEQLVSTVFNTVSTGICITDKTGRFVDMNDQYCRIYGYTKEELLGKKISMMVVPEYRKMMMKHHEAFINEGKEPPGEYDVVTKSGKVIKVSVKVDLLVKPDGERFKVSSVTDITSLKEMESALALLINNTEESFILMDKALHIVTFNHQFQKLYKQYFGMDVKVGVSILEYAQPERREALEDIYKRVLKGGQEEAVITLPLPDNPRSFMLKYKPARNSAAQIIGAFVTITDITEKKKATDQLAMRERRFRSLVENSGDAVAIISPDGQSLYVSPSIKNVLGYGEKEAMELKLASLIHDDDIHLVNAVMQKSMNEPGVPQVPTIARAKHQDGSWRWVEATITNMLNDPAINGIVDNFRDVTDRVEAEMQLRQSEAYLLEAQRLAKMGSWNFDFEADRLTWTEALYDVFGVDKVTFLETHSSFLDFVNPEDRDFVEQTSKNSQLTGEPFHINYRIITQAGERRIVEEHGYGEKNTKGKVIRLFGTAQDITERLKAEEQVRLSNERFELVNKATNDAIYDWNVDKDVYEWGEGFTRMFGHQPGNHPFRLRDWEALMHPTDDKRHQKAWNLFLTSRDQHRWNKEFRFRRADRSYAWVEEIGHLIRDKEGKPVRMIGVLRDISATKHLEIQNQVQHQVAHFFKEDTNLANTLKQVLKFLSAVGGYVVAEIWLIGRNNDHLTLTATYTEDEFAGFYHDKKDAIKHMSKGEGFPGWIWKNLQEESWDEIGSDKRFLRYKRAKEQKLKSAFGLPLLHNDVPVGVLVLLSDIPIENDKSKTSPYFPLGNFLGAEIKRKQQEEEMLLLFQSAPDILAITSPDGYFVKVNPAFCELLGYTEEELTSSAYYTFVHPDDLKGTVSEYGETISGDRQANNFTNRLQTKSGGYRWISWNSSKVFGEEGHVFSFGRDVTEIKELQNLLDNASQLARVGGWEVDMVNNKVFWSHITKEIHEVENEYEPDLGSAIDFYREDDRKLVTENVDKAIQSGLPWDFELPIITAKGNECWVRSIGQAEFVKGKCIRIFGSFQDIHQRKTAELRLQNTSDNIPGAIFQYLFHPDGTDEIRNLTKGAFDIWHYTHEECMKDINLIWDQTRKGGTILW